MDVYETDLPGVGKRFELPLGGGESVVIVVHNSGQRELFRRPDADADSELLLELSDTEARTLGSVLEGIHFQPTQSDKSETLIGGDTMIEWYTLTDDSALVGETIEDADIRQRTGVTVMAVQRGDDAYPSPEPEFEFRAGDVVVTIGTESDQESFHSRFA
ncbi:MAG: cation:proton antiporter regulatory subunit [Halobacteriota archaeon]